MLNYLQNKTAIITGASNGIGMEIGRKFLLAGANVVFSDYVKFDLESIISGVAIDPGSAHSFYGNMQDKLAINNLIATTLNKYEKVDILVNANRTIIPSNPLDEKGGALEKSISQNLIATLNVSQLFAKSVIKQTENRKNVIAEKISLPSITKITVPSKIPANISFIKGSCSGAGIGLILIGIMAYNDPLNLIAVPGFAMVGAFLGGL